MTELLAPAGSVEALDAAIAEGADAVYLGLKNFNARMRTTNFAWNQFEAATSILHKMGKKIYVTVNTVFEEKETETLYRFLSYLNEVGPDGIIVQDFATIRMAQEFFPNLPLHASTQMNVASSSAINLLAKEGVSRVVLSRELGLEEVKKIRTQTKTELEIFVHGALCVSESGLCMFSSFLGGKSANRGMCTQACRRLYTAHTADGDKQGYFFSPCDLQLIEQIPALMEIGINSFKIEGRMKSAEYVGSVVAAYRYVMDNWEKDKKGALITAKRMLSSDFARAKTSYWYNFKTVESGVEEAGAKILNPSQAGGTGIYLGKIATTKPLPKNNNFEQGAKLAHLEGGSYEPDPGDSIRLHKKDDTGRVSHKVRTVEQDEGEKRWIDIPHGFGQGDSVYLLQTKSMSKRYAKILPKDLSKYKKHPGNEILPILDLTPIQKNELSFFPEGLYIQVSTLQDLFIVQAGKPVRIIIELNHETKNALLVHKTTLPLSKKQLFIFLDPFVGEGNISELNKTIESLVHEGFATFVVNNISHIALLSKYKNINMVAGPYLYTFNRWAASWLENQNIGAFVMPYENSRKNLLKTFEPNVRARMLLPVFAYPALFRLRFKLPGDYDFTYFTDKEDMLFKVNSTPDGSFVMPETAFSITDKIDLLYGDGFKRLLLDFSKTKVTKSQFKEVMNSVIKKMPLQGAERFNWKDGFFAPDRLDQKKSR